MPLTSGQPSILPLGYTALQHNSKPCPACRKPPTPVAVGW